MTEAELEKRKVEQPWIERQNQIGLEKTLTDMKMAKVNATEFAPDRKRLVIERDGMVPTRFGTVVYRMGQVIIEPDDIARVESSGIFHRVLSEPVEAPRGNLKRAQRRDSAAS